MTVVQDMIQNGAEWEQFRFEHFGASEAAAMLGISKKTTRNELLKIKRTGNPKQFSRWVQENVLDKGLIVEAKARQHINKLVGQRVYPMVCEDGKLSASCDGLTMDESIATEHKQWNIAHSRQVAAGTVPDEHMPQCQQILLVTKADKLLFVVSDGTPEKMVSVWVFPDTAWFLRITEGWEQFERDLAAFELPAATQAAVIGRAPQNLPALRLEVTGAVTVSNLEEYRDFAVAQIKTIKLTIDSDEDDADAFAAVKWCEAVEVRMEAARGQSMPETIAEVFRFIDDIKEASAKVRIALVKLIERRRIERKDTVLLKAREAFTQHVEKLAAEMDGFLFSVPSPDFLEAAKNKRTINSLQNAIDTALANGKIAADKAARDMRENIALLKADGAGYEFLFNDKQTLVKKQPDDLKLLIKVRVDAQKAGDEKRDEAARQKERDDQAAKVATAAADKTAEAATVTDVVSRPIQQAPVIASVFTAPAPRVALYDTDGPPLLELGVISLRLGFMVTADFLKTLGFVPVAKDKSALLFHERQFAEICVAIIAHVKNLSEQRW